jgi:hypothetical protein
MIRGDADHSEKDNTHSLDSSRSLGSSSTPIRTAKKIKKKVANNHIKGNSTKSEEPQLRIRTKMTEHKSARSKQQEQDGKPRYFSKTSEILIALSEGIEDMNLEMKNILEELERAQGGKKIQHAAREGVDEEFLAGRENKILKTRLQSGQSTIDSIRADISRMASSTRDCKNTLREAKTASRPLQLEQEKLLSKLQEAEGDLKALEAEARYKRTARKVEIDQKEIFEQASREILDLQRNYRLKKQTSQRKMQEREQKKKPRPKHHMQQQLQDQIQEKPLKRDLKRQSSWWQLNTPEEAPAQDVCSQSNHTSNEAIGRSTIDYSILDTSFDSSGSAVG